MTGKAEHPDASGAADESAEFGGGADEESREARPGAVDPLDALLEKLADAPDEEIAPAPPRRLEPGASVSRYKVVRELGRGGFGVVYEARDGDLGRHVALKALRPDRLGRGGKKGEEQRALRLSLLQQEAETVARLQHPNIVTLYDLVLQDGLPYLVLELLSGETLQAALARGPVPPAEAIEIGIQVARGLTHAHAAGVIHRDLKPSNVFRTHDGLVKLLDLGLARGLAGDALLPRAGTPGFMAPEQWRGAEDERSDVYGAGLLLHALLGGRLPHAFSGTGSLPRSESMSTAAQRSSLQKAAMSPALLEVPASAPAELALLIQRACSADPSMRPQSARALLDELLAFQRATPSSPLVGDSWGTRTPQLGPLPPAPAPPQRSVRVALLVLLLAICSVVPWMVTRHPSSESVTAARPPPPPTPLPPQEVNTFRETGPLLSPRANASALLLRNGLVLVAGGADEEGASAGAELFDPLAQAGAGAFRPTASMVAARQGASATLLGDGRALLAGGEGKNGSLASLELYESGGNRGRGAFWSGPQMHTARSGQCAILLGDGRVLLAGGEHDGQPIADAELFDPRLVAADGARGNLLGPFAMGLARSRPACAMLPDGRALIAGGISSSGEPLASAEIFDPEAAEGRGAFVATGNLAEARALASAVRLDDGRIFVAGGLGGEKSSRAAGRAAVMRTLASVERFDPLANSGRGGFLPAPPLLSPRRAGAALALANGSILFAGGTGDNDNRLASAELYSPESGPSARPTMNLSTPRGGPAAALLADGRVLLAGGDQRAGRSVSSSELFLPRGLSQAALVVGSGPMHTPRAFASTVRLNDGSVVIAGGRAGSTLDSLERFDPRTALFSEAGHLKLARTGAAAALLPSGEVLIAGGLDSSGAPVASAELLQARDGQLRSQLASPLATARAFAATVLLPDGRALVVGGTGGSANGSDGAALASVELFDPRDRASGHRGAFVATGPLATARSEPMLALLPDGRALVAGGLSSSGVPLASAEIFDPFANGGRGGFVATASMAQGRTRAVIALLPNGKVLIAGGFGQAALASAELFDPAADNGRGAFTQTGGLAVARQRAGAELLANGTVLIAGGADAEGGALASAELFEPQGDDGIGNFVPAAGLSVGRELPSTARLPGGGVLVAGGRNNGVLSSAEIWKPQ